jgi:hypothetical protein
LPLWTSVALIDVAPSITWLLVRTTPSLADKMMPVPSAVSLWYFSVEVMSTIPGSTFASSACWFSVPPEGAVLPPPDPLPGCGMSCEEILGVVLAE